MKRFLLLLGIALAAIVPAVVLRLGGFRPNPLLDTAVFGASVLAAAFMLSWGAVASAAMGVDGWPCHGRGRGHPRLG